ncbi:SDR family NAD(P)-dependent oxidoreductase [Streptomonospora nanhaiensis]|uniref:NAD(P)-dependent dehydrogenase (Short-subunit alcohol dehydrogenase family) n=1 Tax=Streptomonospora nanhaiensis TaxID=1323731 RepID=A0A853BI63_9ACTN|nr:SDR family NAD(P)-dependent oxidoreductase [Streptomonospora nanhaiensis]MBV2366483.1 SDR family NAD(P)-dependent oxidoreductase [Streptomonospora nanhaiensis]MBX9390002.1 SDR family NAD(P)-dependent oxidoreductase [Streptomonospora nanhaiensis]NYI94267.1 NAD(P)-dependent dehydrogenase (short-subunit alcohol dehydrogenase family) [Streptomonospora nanhaiensis]
MTTALITGATRGLGYETARRLVAAGHTVYAGARDARRGEAAARALGARPLLLDVTDPGSVDRAAARVAEEAGHLDILVNNAGIVGARKPVTETTAEDLLACYDTNLFGAVRVLRAFLPLLERGPAPVVVNVSSGLGSLAAATDERARAAHTPTWLPALDYATAKAALNMATALYAHACPRLRINAVDPGHTATDLNGHTGAQTVAEGAEIIVRMATTGPDGPTGGFFSSAGPVPW